jgi:hypothetical protein
MTGFRGKTVIKIAGSGATLMALTSDGTVFTAGDNTNAVSIDNSSFQTVIGNRIRCNGF